MSECIFFCFLFFSLCTKITLLKKSLRCRGGHLSEPLSHTIQIPENRPLYQSYSIDAKNTVASLNFIFYQIKLSCLVFISIDCLQGIESICWVLFFVVPFQLLSRKHLYCHLHWTTFWLLAIYGILFYFFTTCI